MQSNMDMDKACTPGYLAYTRCLRDCLGTGDCLHSEPRPKGSPSSLQAPRTCNRVASLKKKERDRRISDKEEANMGDNLTVFALPFFAPPRKHSSTSTHLDSCRQFLSAMLFANSHVPLLLTQKTHWTHSLSLNTNEHIMRAQTHLIRGARRCHPSCEPRKQGRKALRGRVSAERRMKLHSVMMTPSRAGVERSAQ